MGWLVDHEETRELLERYVALLELPTDRLRVTTERRVFESWLGRRVAELDRRRLCIRARVR